MPEGDSIHTLALRLSRVLVGRSVASFTARRLPDDVTRSLVGRRVVEVRAKGKNLLIVFDDGRVLLAHLRMQGRIFVLSGPRAVVAAERFPPEMRLVVVDTVTDASIARAVPKATIVGHRVPVVRLLTAVQVRRALASLGPDLVDDDYDEAEAIRRLRALGTCPVAEAILVQRAVAGIGNVYKSEVLFLEGLDPRAPTASVGDDALRAVLRRAHRLLRHNVRVGPRVTRPTAGGGTLWVYGRHGKPCFRCGATIERFFQGSAPGRSTYRCPACQPSFAPKREQAVESHGPFGETSEFEEKVPR